MVFYTPEPNSVTAAKRPYTALLRSVTALASLCAKKAGRVTKKLNSLKSKPSQPSQPSHDPPSPPRSPLVRPKNMLKTISQSAMSLVQKKKTGRRAEEEEEEEEEEEWGHGGVWQRGILMGDKCQPLDFSGAIYYDSYGNKMNEPPLRSPRASPLPGYLLRKPEPLNPLQ